MTKLPFKQHIADLAELLKHQGVRDIVICPGSRNAPLIQVFQREPAFNCYSIVDERSAGYVAIGMSTETHRPVVVITTSGTAVLNLAPAVAEAFNQNIPLIILTGDRPDEIPPQFTNQRINQANVFGANAAGFYQLTDDFKNAGHLQKVMQEVADVVQAGCIDQQGPVHVNLLLHEPLYKEIPTEVMTNIKLPTAGPFKTRAGISTSDGELIRDHLIAQKKILILAGMANYYKSARETLLAFGSGFQVAVIAENITNLHGPMMVSAPELVLASATEEKLNDLIPDLVIAMGGPVVSKRTRLFVQALEKTPMVILNSAPEHLMPGLLKLITETGIHDLPRNGNTDIIPDKDAGDSKTQDANTVNFPGNSSQMKEIEKKPVAVPGNSGTYSGTNSYGRAWKEIEEHAAENAGSFFHTAPYSNISVMSRIMQKLPENTTVHLGNSGMIRYSQLMPAREDLKFQGNRGTSGIDGSLSTAVGAAMVSDQNHLAILGDLSFVYDSNALWNNKFPSNLRIIVLNDKGGGIFRLLDGPDRMPFFKEYSVTGHPVNFEHLVKAFGMNILQANNDYTLDESLGTLFDWNPGTNVLEVDTSGSKNSDIFKQFFKYIHP